MVTVAKRVNVPKPGATKEKEAITMIGAARMLAIYNQDHPSLKTPAKRITPKITNHIGKLAIDAGWAGAAVAKDAITGHTSGTLLLRTKTTTIQPDVIDAEAVQRKALKG